ncbi:hypothetical protein E2C01_070409 [Portunus trituberculatus]|uniref:Uncharacterized protein n=1 Tax=Portunus trituberculatus TaxID=210409 RepID=A0A5B7I559_PORTR|nr:hypothetical protein [Portunus trituberculatus]
MVNGGNYLSKPAAQVFCGGKSLPCKASPRCHICPQCSGRTQRRYPVKHLYYPTSTLITDTKALSLFFKVLFSSLFSLSTLLSHSTHLHSAFRTPVVEQSAVP